MNKIMLAAALCLATTGGAFAKGKHHQVVFHVNEADAQKMNMVLNNVENTQSQFASQGDTVDIEIVAYGPGLNMFVDGKSPVSERLSVIALASDTVHFSACGNTLAKMEKNTGGPVALLDDVGVVPSGVVRLIELQEDGWFYVRP